MALPSSAQGKGGPLRPCSQIMPLQTLWGRCHRSSGGSLRLWPLGSTSRPKSHGRFFLSPGCSGAAQLPCCSSDRPASCVEHCRLLCNSISPLLAPWTSAAAFRIAASHPCQALCLTAMSEQSEGDLLKKASWQLGGVLCF